MAYTKDYIDNMPKNRESVVKGTISIKEIDPKVVEDYGIKIGTITPFTSLKVVR